MRAWFCVRYSTAAIAKSALAWIQFSGQKTKVHHDNPLEQRWIPPEGCETTIEMQDRPSVYDNTTLAGSMVTRGVTTCQHRTHERVW